MLQVFFMNHLPQATKNNIRAISNLFENSRRYSQVKVHRRYQQHWWQNCLRCQQHRRQTWHCCHTTSGKFAIGINYTGGKFATGTTGVVDTGGKLPPPVLTTQTVNLPQGIMETISDFLHLEVNKKTKIYLLVKSTTQRCPNKIFKTFLIEDFFICHWWCNITENIERVSIYHSRICSMYNKPSRSC